MKQIDVTSDSYAEYSKYSNENGPKFKVRDMSEFENTKTFLLKDTLKIGQKKILLLVKLENTVPWTYVISDVMNDEEITGSFL